MKSFLSPLIFVPTVLAAVLSQAQIAHNHDLVAYNYTTYNQTLDPRGDPGHGRGKIKDGECLPLHVPCKNAAYKAECNDDIPNRYCKQTYLNELSPTHACKNVSVIWVAWSALPQTNFDPWAGSFVDELNYATGLDAIAVSGLDYTIDVYKLSEIQNIEPTGYEDAADGLEKRLSQLVERCPMTQIVLGGRMHGARIVRAAVSRRHTVAQSDKVKAIVLYHDPWQSQWHYYKELPRSTEEKILNLCNYWMMWDFTKLFKSPFDKMVCMKGGAAIKATRWVMQQTGYFRPGTPGPPE